MTTVGNTFWVDTETTTLHEADHLLQTLAAELALPEDTFGCTHLVHGERPRVVLSFTGAPAQAPRHLTAKGYRPTPGTPDEAGRAVLYPGVSRLTGTLTIAELLSASAIDHVTVLGSPGEPPPGQRVLTRDHVRPQWHTGKLILTTTPAAGGVLAPFEVPDPTPCCADH
ncbi:hypothetical protein FE633_08535 [Streptomyces montanus]|uniref:Uncharacterized protein n=1 Tax=Streptomyces montanus TaxID=2580423 RepID=A0A5R9FRV0_9ACTN|nr:hypothetical protein [Streptomyces montanus]TLS46717.1 hypothetical protein FE633_08535 [Streptomyces montanus]